MSVSCVFEETPREMKTATDKAVVSDIVNSVHNFVRVNSVVTNVCFNVVRGLF